MESSKDPLEALLADEEDVARDELAAVLKPYVRLTRAGDLVFEDAFQSLGTRGKVACVLLALKASSMLGLRSRPGASPQELVETSGIPPGSVRPKLSELARMRVVSKEGRDYVVPTHATRRLARLIEGESGR